MVNAVLYIKPEIFKHNNYSYLGCIKYTIKIHFLDKSKRARDVIYRQITNKNPQHFINKVVAVLFCTQGGSIAWCLYRVFWQWVVLGIEVTLLDGKMDGISKNWYETGH